MIDSGIARVRVAPDWALPPIAGIAAFCAGTLVAARPSLGLGLVTFAAVTALAVYAPVLHLTALLFITAVVPYELQNAFSSSGPESPGLLVADLLLITGVARAALVLPSTPLTRLQFLIVTAAFALLAIFVVQAARGILAGASLSVAGYELRALLGWGAVLIALPIVRDPAGRRRLLAGLLVVGLALGVWGIVQYFADIPLSPGRSWGIHDDVNYTAGARSIQGGLFGYPVAFVIALAALTSLSPLRLRTQAALLAIAALAGMSLLLTYERTFWIAAAVGIAFYAIRARRAERVRVIVAVVVVAAIALPLLVVLSPGALGAVRDRFTSIRQYESDDSVRARVVESRAVLAKIRERELFGSGLGDEVRFGYAWLDTPDFDTNYTHNGYLWLAWKIGIPATALFMAVIALAVVPRSPPGLTSVEAAIRHGAQAALIMTLIISLLFPAFRGLAITSTLGVLVALCTIRGRMEIPRAGPRDLRAEGR